MKELNIDLVDVMEQLMEAVEKLNQHSAERVAKITATVDSEREQELERRLTEAEAKLAELAASSAATGRKTAAFSKHGAALEQIDATSLDTALASLSIEQRLAVKAELLRSGTIA